MAKLDARRIPTFLAEPGDCRVVLLLGDDPGLIAERAEALVRAVTAGDALRLVELPKETLRHPATLANEAATLPLMGGRVAVRVREVGEGKQAAEAAKAALAGPGPGLVVLEAPGLPTKSALCRAVEAAANGAMIACYRERGADLAASIGRILGELGVSAEPAAIEWLSQRLGEDRMLLRRELEKLALYVGAGGRASAEDVIAAVAEGSALDLEEALMAAMAGDLPLADRALDLAFAEGANAVQVVRRALAHVQRLQQAALAMAEGAPARAAIEGLRPPVFFRHKPMLERALGVWRAETLAAAGTALLEAERRTKSTGIPAETIARGIVMTLARQGAARR
jgi:DNA polymerase III subunit delta